MHRWKVYGIKKLRQAIANQLIDMAADISWMPIEKVDVVKMNDSDYFHLIYALTMRIKGSLLEQSAEKQIGNYTKIVNLRD